ncbi:alanine racemase [Treponema sp.]
MQATQALIHLDNLSYNLAAIRKKIGKGCAICLPIKADAYGHGSVPIAQAALKAGVSHFAIATVQEGEALRKAGISAPLLLFSIPLPEELDSLARYDLQAFVTDSSFATELSKAAKKQGAMLTVHLKIDTGMGRIGCRVEDAAALAQGIEGLKNLKIAGCASHLSVSDSQDTDDLAYTERQLSAFHKAIGSIRKCGIQSGLLHIANSGGILLHKASHLDMVRPGILSYGYYPSEETRNLIQLKPVMELRTRVVFIKNIRKGESVSYGRIWTADRDTKIGTLPIGYADGLPRLLSNNLSVSIAGKFYPLVGRICMDQCMVDLGPHSDVQRFESVSIFGGPASGADELAQKLETISYEILCGINKRVPRVYTK